MIKFDNIATFGGGIQIGPYASAPAWLLPPLVAPFVPEFITTNSFLDMSFGSGGAYQIWFNPTNGYGIQGGTIHASMDDIELGWEAYDAATDTQYGVVTAVSGQSGFADSGNRYITLSVSGFSTGLDWYFKSPAGPWSGQTTTPSIQNVAGSDGAVGFFFTGSWASLTGTPNLNDVQPGWLVTQIPGAVVVSTDAPSQTITISGGVFVSGTFYTFVGV
jgi:hypothetical protein